MIVIEDAGQAADFVGYAENLIKNKIKEKGAAVIDPETMQKVKEDKMLWQAIRNASATAMARIMTDYGAKSLIRGRLSVEARQKFAASWEGTAALSLNVIDTRTAEELASPTSDPLGTSQNPAPIEDSPLIAKQMAVRRVCESVLIQLGAIPGMGTLKGVTTIAFDLFDIFPSPFNDAQRLCFTSDGRNLVIGGGRQVGLWDLYAKKVTRQYSIPKGRVTAIAVQPENRFLAAGDSRGDIHMWALDGNGGPTTIAAHKKDIVDLSFAPDGNRLASASDDERVQIVDIRFGQVLGTLKGHGDTVHSVAFTENGRSLISASEDKTIRWWDTNTYKEKKSIRESADKLLQMDISQDGQAVALSTVDVHIDLVRNSRRDVRHIMVRNTATGEEIRELAGHKKDVTTLSFHPNKRFLASGSIDNSIRIWDLQKGDIVASFEQNDDIHWVAFSDDGQWFAALCRDGRITVWKLR